MKAMRIILSLVILSLILAFAFTFTTAYATDIAYINVSVATLWREPNLVREIDKPSACSPVNIRQWVQNMGYDQQIWLTRQLETQALYGQRVQIIEDNGAWVKVVVEGQPTPRHVAGYPGWMPRGQLTPNRSIEGYAKNPLLIVKKNTAWLYNNKNASSVFMEISFNTHLPVLGQADGWVEVATPANGSKWIRAEDVAVFLSWSSIPKPTGNDLVNTAKMFLNLPYLWAGVSGFGFDCSGFTHTIYKAHGITIPRDASVQATAGVPVEREGLKPGDLIFFAYSNGLGRIHHVGMYIGDNKFIHSPKTGRVVSITSLDDPEYGPEYAMARRYLE